MKEKIELKIVIKIRMSKKLSNEFTSQQIEIIKEFLNILHGSQDRPKLRTSIVLKLFNAIVNKSALSSEDSTEIFNHLRDRNLSNNEDLSILESLLNGFIYCSTNEVLACCGTRGYYDLPHSLLRDRDVKFSKLFLLMMELNTPSGRLIVINDIIDNKIYNLLVDEGFRGWLVPTTWVNSNTSATLFNAVKSV